jgi:SAM-dependent methyltransferase
VPPGRLLDVGTGSGEDLGEFTARGWDAVGLEPFHRIRTPRTVKGIAESLPFRQATFDAVTSILVLPHVESAQEVLVEIHRVLKPGGKALFVLFANSPLNLRVGASEYRPAEGHAARTRLCSSRRFTELLHSAGLTHVAHVRTDYMPWLIHRLPQSLHAKFFGALSSVDSAVSRTPLRFLARKLIVKAARP